MLRLGNAFANEREKALADGLKEVASDLRLVEAADLVAFIRTGQFANIASLVSSSTELYFKPDTVSFANSAAIDLSWDSAPAITLDMEFCYRRVNAHFRLHLEAKQAAVEIDYVTFEDGSADPNENTQTLVQAIAEARLGPALHCSN